MNMQPHSSPVLTIACVVGTLAGIAMNVQLAYWDINEKIMGPVVWLIIAFMSLGFLPGMKKWIHGKKATIITSISIVLYFIHGIWQTIFLSSS